MKRLLLIIVLLSVTCMPAYAAAPSTNVYEIEVVVFENRNPDLEGGELWDRDPDKSANADMNDAVSVGEKPAADSALSATAADAGKLRPAPCPGASALAAERRGQIGFEAGEGRKCRRRAGRGAAVLFEPLPAPGCQSHAA